MCLLWLLVLVALANTVESSVIRTSSGVIKGKRLKTVEGEVFQYLGIPYAQPPVGKKRFRPPQKLPSSASSIEISATRYPPACYQPPHMLEVINSLLRTKSDMSISEDCLNLNIFVPHVNQRDLMPVMVWLPGEGFDFSDANQFDATYLAALSNVIVVTVHYRVGVFGFLATKSEEAPGNVGLLDQRMALWWISNNIKKFGGDPTNVTLFGRFSGSMSISMHMTSSYALNSTEKLFNRVILQSGIGVGRWVFDDNPKMAVEQLGKFTNCTKKTDSELVACLQQIPADILLKHSLHVPQRWRPIIDGKFLTKEPLEAVKDGQHAEVDVILGNNVHEGSLCLLTLYAQKSKLYEKILKDQITEDAFSRLIDDSLFHFFGRRNNITRTVVQHDYGYRQTGLRDSFLDFCGDLFITSIVDQFSRLLAKSNKGRIYRYEFAHRPGFSIHPDFIQAAHGDDIFYSLGLTHKLEGHDNEKELSRRMVELFVKFSKYGNFHHSNESTTTIWPEYTSSQKRILRFNSMDTEIISGNYYDKAHDLWFNIVPLINKSGVEDNSTSLYLVSKKEPHLHLINKLISIETAEYVLIGSVCFVIILLLTLIVVLGMVSDFRIRLKSKLLQLKS